MLTNQFVCFVHISLGHLFEFVYIYSYIKVFLEQSKWIIFQWTGPERIPYFAASDVLLSQATFLPSRGAEEKAPIEHMLPIILLVHRYTHTSKHTHHTLASVCVCVTSPKQLLAARSSTEWFSKERNVCMCLFALECLSLWRPVKSGISFALRQSFKELLNDSDLVMCFKLEPDAGLGKPLIYDG